MAEILYLCVETGSLFLIHLAMAQKNGKYIQQIEIDALWNGQKHVVWDLRPDVNILSGVNGVGKSTILNRVVKQLLSINKIDRDLGGVRLKFYPEDATGIDFDIIRSFDRPILSSEYLNRVTDTELNTELDFHLYQLQRQYLDYQVNLSNRMVEVLTQQGSDAQQKAQDLALEKTHFLDLVDSLFKDTGKKIERSMNEIYFQSLGEVISPYKLSSGEKQMLIILLTVLVQNKKPYVLFLDEPEVSLHVEWQQRLIGIIRDLNPNIQVIMTTHSPAVIMDGWADCVTDVEEIVS